MLAAIYAGYSSENQRPESIEDQVAACRRLSGQRGFTIVEEHIYSDEAQSGVRKDRPGLATLLSSAQSGQFQAVLVDDLSRLARDNYQHALGVGGAPLCRCACSLRSRWT